MDNREVKLSVNNLKISFRTDGGKVQAVRDISFNLYKGETLAIVGESGSGKSVTNRAIMGILANNAIKDGGEIIYDGRDLMKIPEEQFHKLRGPPPRTRRRAPRHIPFCPWRRPSSDFRFSFRRCKYRFRPLRDLPK